MNALGLKRICVTLACAMACLAAEDRIAGVSIPAGCRPVMADEALPRGAMAAFGSSRFRAAGQVTAIDLAPKGETLATLNASGLLRLWDVATGQLLNQFTVIRGGRALSWSADGKYLALIEADGKVSLLDAKTCREGAKKLPEVKNAFSLCVAFSLDSKALAVGSYGAVRIYDVASGELTRTLDAGDQAPEYFVFRPQTDFLDAFSPAKQIRWNWVDGTKVGEGKATFERYFKPYGYSRSSTRFIADGPIATVYRSEADGGMAQIITGKTRIRGLAVSADGKTLATGHDDGILKIWSIADKRLVGEVQASGEQVAASNSRDISFVSLSDDGSVVAAVSQYGNRVRVWNLAEGALECEFGGEERNMSFAVMPDNRRLLAGGLDGRIRVWDLQTRKLLQTIEGHKAGIYALAIDPAGATFASGSMDSAILLWDARTLPAIDPQ